MVAISSSKMPAAAPIRAVTAPVLRDELAAFVAHDLRTPLATLAMNLDFLLEELHVGERVTPDARSALEDCRGANVQAVRMVCDMTDALVLASGDRKAVLAEVDVGAVVAAVVEVVAGEAKAWHVAITSRVEPTLAQADVELIARVVERVVERALWLARCGGRVDIVLEGDALAVSMSPAPSRGVSAGRSLGTYLAEVAMRAQGGALTIAVDDATRTLTFRITLPSDAPLSGPVP
ncbi:MAG: histidine kinase dimerization/phospho-acceptor domain-containing protein [Polyangiaceae bacterium]